MRTKRSYALASKNIICVLVTVPDYFQDNADGEGQEFLVGAQTEQQKNILEGYNSHKPRYVEGPYFIWVRRLQRYFFTLRTDAEFDEENGEGGSGVMNQQFVFFLSICIFLVELSFN